MIMSKAQKAVVKVQGTNIVVLARHRQNQDFISLTDIAKHKEPDRSDHVIQNWMRNRNTVEFLGTWERLNNPDFKPLEFEGFRNKAGLNAIAIRQMLILTTAPAARQLKGEHHA
jgi:hypothetical protein